MNNDEQAMEHAVMAALEPYREVLERMMTLIERLTLHVEILELERLYAAEAEYDDET